MQEADRRALLEIARDAVARAAEHADPAETASVAATGGALAQPRAAFVTLHEASGALRGCVGTTAATRPLDQTVREMARAAALRDPRFVPVARDEVASLDIEISVLEPLERIHSIDDVEIGRHGLVVEGRGRRGLLLPQVAAERSWTPQLFAEQTCEKAGLEPDAYRADDVALYRFSTEVFR